MDNRGSVEMKRNRSGRQPAPGAFGAMARALSLGLVDPRARRSLCDLHTFRRIAAGLTNAVTRLWTNGERRSLYEQSVILGWLTMLAVVSLAKETTDAGEPQQMTATLCHAAIA